MRLAISGSRDWPMNRKFELIKALVLIEIELEKIEPIDGYEIGDAKGVDEILYDALNWNGYNINQHKAYWKKMGNYAGHERNSRVLLNADALFAAPLGEAKGTNNCINQALKKGIPVYVYQNGEVKLHCSSKTQYQEELFG